VQKSPVKAASTDVIEPITKPMLKKRQKSQSEIIKRQTRSSEADVDVATPVAEATVENKPKRGRKKKHVVSHIVSHKAVNLVQPSVKRKPGRPKKKKRGFAKVNAEEEVDVAVESASNDDVQKPDPEIPVKRGPGRPRKSDSIVNSSKSKAVAKPQQSKRDKAQFNQKIRNKYKLMLAKRPTRSVVDIEKESEQLPGNQMMFEQANVMIAVLPYYDYMWHALIQGWANYVPRAACGPPCYILRPSNTF
jgi:hypothetical protein